MNPAQLLDHFDRISDAPDAIPRLRRFILDLGVREKLVEQDPNEDPASKPHVNLPDIRFFKIPLPSTAVQHRIVAKVEELMALCDRLEAQLTTAQTESRRLLEAVLHEALAPAV